jgi:hypothetical protein
MHCCFHVFFITRYHPASAIVFFGCLFFLSVKNGLNLQADELRWAVLLALDVEEEWLPKYIDAKLKVAAESIQYEDWAVDYNLVCFSYSDVIMRWNWMADVHMKT